MDFKTAVKRVSEGATQEEIARALAASYYRVKQATSPDKNGGYRAPPPGWEKGLAKLARKRSEDLSKLADALDPPEKGKQNSRIWGGIR